jgi:hypothetical protein
VRTPSIRLGVVVAPGLASDVTTGIADDLAADLRQSYDAVEWETELAKDRLVVPPATLTELVEAAREALLARDWDLGVVVTDLPLRIGGRPVSRHISPTHGIAVVSLPALGPLHLRQRLRNTLVDLIGDLLREETGGDRHALRQLAADTGHLRVLLGMIRANRPWRFAARLYGTLVAAIAAAAFGLITSDTWRTSSVMGWPRLLLMAVAAIALTVAAVIVRHHLWERAPDPRVRDQVVLFNVTTAATVLVGMLTLYVVLFLVILGAAELVVPPRALERALGRASDQGDYAALAWFIASAAIVGGGLGTALESDEAVREAAYASSRASEGQDARSG